MGLNELMPERLVWEWQLVDVCLSCGQNVMRTVYTYIPIIRVLYNGGLAPKRCNSSALALSYVSSALSHLNQGLHHMEQRYSPNPDLRKSAYFSVALRGNITGLLDGLVQMRCYISLHLSIVLVNYGISSAYALDILQFTDPNGSTLVLRCIVSGVASVYR